MNLPLWLYFVGTVLIIAITPGLSVLLATANTMNHGVKKLLELYWANLGLFPIQLRKVTIG